MFKMKVKSSVSLSAKELAAATEKATRRAGDVGARQLRKETGDYILEKKALRSSFVRPQLELRRPRQVLKWWLRVLGAPVPLERYPFKLVRRGRRYGVVAQVNRGRWMALGRRAFAAVSIRGSAGSFSVTSRLFKRRGRDRYPIQRLYSSRLTDVLQNESFRTVQMRAIFRMSLEFERIAPLELAKLAKKGSR